MKRSPGGRLTAGPGRSALPVRGPERRDQPRHQRGQEDLPGERLHDGDGLPGAVRRREVAVAQGGQRGEAEILKGLRIAWLPVREELVTAEVVDRREKGGEHQADDHISAERAEDA